MIQINAELIAKALKVAKSGIPFNLNKRPVCKNGFKDATQDPKEIFCSVPLMRHFLPEPYQESGNRY